MFQHQCLSDRLVNQLHNRQRFHQLLHKSAILFRFHHWRLEQLLYPRLPKNLKELVLLAHLELLQ
jgi:hypothetical protein